MKGTWNWGTWIPMQKLSKERQEIRDNLLQNLGKKVDEDLANLFKNNNFGNGSIIDIRVLYDNNGDKLSFLHTKYGRHNKQHKVLSSFSICYEGSKINVPNVKCFVYDINDISIEVRLSDDNRLYLPIRKLGAKHCIEADRIYIDEFIKF